MGELYGISKQTAAIAIALVMGRSLAPGSRRFKTIGIHSRLTPHRAYILTLELKIKIRVRINNYKDFQIITTLYKRGRSQDLAKEIGNKANLPTLPRDFKLVYDYVKVHYSPRYNLETSRYIAVKIPEEHYLNLSINEKKVRQIQ